MALLAAVTALGAAALLLWAGLEKIRSPVEVRTALRRLGVREDAVAATASSLAALEIVVALGLVFVPRSAWTLGGVVVLSTAFAVAGGIALSRDEPIYCGCFGAGARGRLGALQVAALPVWLAIAALLALAGPLRSSLAEGAIALAAIGLALAALRGVGVLRAWRVARGDRRSAQEMLVWLR